MIRQKFSDIQEERLYKEEPSCLKSLDTEDRENTSSGDIPPSEDSLEGRRVEKFSYLDTNLAQEDIDDA